MLYYHSHFSSRKCPLKDSFSTISCRELFPLAAKQSGNWVIYFSLSCANILISAQRSESVPFFASFVLLCTALPALALPGHILLGSILCCLAMIFIFCILYMYFYLKNRGKEILFMVTASGLWDSGSVQSHHTSWPWLRGQGTEPGTWAHLAIWSWVWRGVGLGWPPEWRSCGMEHNWTVQWLGKRKTDRCVKRSKDSEPRRWAPDGFVGLEGHGRVVLWISICAACSSLFVLGGGSQSTGLPWTLDESGQKANSAYGKQRSMQGCGSELEFPRQVSWLRRLLTLPGCETLLSHW